jgi:hypothetical protein
MEKKVMRRSRKNQKRSLRKWSLKRKNLKR